MAELNLKELVKQHPYATGGVVIVGGLVAFYLLSGSQSQPSGSSARSSSGGGSSTDYSSALAYNSQIAQLQAAQEQQQTAANVQLQQDAYQAQVANNQTAASLQANNVNTAASLAATLAQLQASTAQNKDTLEAQTTQQANQLVYAQNIQQMQDSVLMSQINAGVLENANNNATALAGTEASLSYQTYLANLQAQVANHGIDASLSLAQQQEADYQSNTAYVLSQAGKSYNTANDANRATTLYSQVLAGGNPAPVIANQQGQTSQNIASSNAWTNVLNTITQTIGKTA